MFSSAILDVIIGLVFVFLVVSLIASALTEALASLLKKRSNTLLEGMKALVSDSSATGLVRALYNHALVNPRDSGATNGNLQPLDQMKFKPAYIDPKQFGNAFIDIAGLVLTPGQTIDQLKQQVAGNNLLSTQTKQLVSGMLDRTGGRLDLLREELAHWFDSGMDRVSGAYKRWSQLISFLIALGVAIVLNIDVTAVARTLWARPMLAQTISSQAADLKDAQKALQTLDSLHLPIGWNFCPDQVQGGQQGCGTVPAPSDWLMRIVGWFIAALAALFGAPFWYDMLQTFVRLKGAGPSPAEKKEGAAAAR